MQRNADYCIRKVKDMQILDNTDIATEQYGHHHSLTLLDCTCLDTHEFKEKFTGQL